MRLFLTSSDWVYIYDFTQNGFEKVPFEVQIVAGSQPFIADFNGDFLHDILYTDATDNKMHVFYQTKNNSFENTLFIDSMLVQDETVGCISKTLPNAILS